MPKIELEISRAQAAAAFLVIDMEIYRLDKDATRYREAKRMILYERKIERIALLRPLCDAANFCMR